MILPKLSRKTLIGLGMIAIFTLTIGGILLMTFTSRVLVLEGDHTFESDYIVTRGRKVIFRDGIFSFTNERRLYQSLWERLSNIPFIIILIIKKNSY